MFPKHREMFTGGLDSMCAVHPTLLHAPITMQIDWLEQNLAFLKDLDDTSHTTVQPNSSAADSAQMPSADSAQMPLPSAIHADLATKSGSEMRTVSISEVPPMPESLWKGKWTTSAKIENGARRTTPLEYWTFCYTHCYSHKHAFQISQLNSAFSEKNPNCQGHMKWLENKQVLLYLYHTAGVKIDMKNKYLLKTLKKYWKENRASLLKLLLEWFQSGAAESLQKSQVMRAALQHIRLEWKEDSWWPNHGNDTDMTCLTDSVVTEDRLLQEWAASKEKKAAYDYFQPEYEEIRIESEIKKSQIGAARGKRKKECETSNTAAMDALASAASAADSVDDCPTSR